MDSKIIQFPALYDPRYPVHKIAGQLEPYLRAIVERIRPERIVLFGSQAYGEPTEHSDVDLLVIRHDITSSKASNLQMRELFWEIEARPLSFTLLSKTPAQVEAKLSSRSPVYEEILGKGITLYAA
jgi:uncharacterized protein